MKITAIHFSPKFDQMIKSTAIVFPNGHINPKYIFLYWMAYVLIFSLIQGVPAHDFTTAFYCELSALIAKIAFVVVITEWLMPKFLFTKKIGGFISLYVCCILLFAIILRFVDNYIILKYFLTSWASQPLLNAPPLIYNAIKLQFLVTIPFTVKLYSWFKENKIQTAPAINEAPVITESFLTVKHDRKMTRINLDHILYIEAQRNYTSIYTAQQLFKIYQSISKIEEQLSTDKFVRVHRSFIISLSKVEAYTSNCVVVGGKEVPIGRVYSGVVGEILDADAV